MLVPPDLLAPKAFKALQDPLALPALRAFRASPGPLDPPGLLASPDPPDLRALRELPAQLVPLAPLALLGRLARKAFRASPGLLAPLVLPVARAQPDPRVPLELVSPDPQAPRAPRVLRVHLEAGLLMGTRATSPSPLQAPLGPLIAQSPASRTPIRLLLAPS